MKKRSIILAAALLAATVSSAWAVNAGNVRYTKHNMSNDLTVGGRFVQSNNESQICIFCHTPHNSQPTYALWNKILPITSGGGTPFQMYTASSTLTSAAKNVGAPRLESLLCLSCHDGRTAINVLHSARSGQTGWNDGLGYVNVDIGGKWDEDLLPDFDGIKGNPLGAYGPLGDLSTYQSNLGMQSFNSGITSDANIFYGRNLTNDHPISFSYVSARTEDSQLNHEDVVNDASHANGAIKFFGSDKRLECGSCHDPHVPYNDPDLGTGIGDSTLDPFLVMSNANSKLCLSCHKK